VLTKKQNIVFLFTNMTATSSTSENLFGIRLRQARERRGFSMRDLQARMTGGLSPAAIAKYEQGKMHPSPGVLHALCEALEMPEDFFRRPLTAKLDSVRFRCKSSLKVKDEVRVRGEAEDFFERYVELEDLLGMLEEFRNPLEGVEIRDGDDVEAAAERVREAWRLGDAPIQSVVSLLEERHVMVHLTDAPEDFDGFAGKAGRRDVVALNRNFPVDRIRFSALHELGHILMDEAIGHLPEKVQESLCHRFGAAMLVTRARFLDLFGVRRRHLDVRELMQVKKMFGISCAAQLKRAEALGVMAPGTMHQLWIKWGRLGFRKKDPGVCEFVEEPSRFNLLLRRAVAENRISHGKAALLAGMPLEQFQESLEILP
jgi:Zn-dependent peptidase ImmA (M78 family)